jgi:hypothetical protein
VGKFLIYVAGICGIFIFHLFWYVRSISVAGFFSPHAWRLVTTAPMPIFMMLAIGAAIVARIAILAMHNERKTIDPKKWTLQETGEFLKVTSIRGNDIIVDTTKYNHRIVAWVGEADRREKSAITYAVVAALILLGGKWLELETNIFSGPPFILYALASLILCVGAWRWGLAERGRWDRVGPPPIVLAEPDEMNTQKAFGDAGLAGLSQIQQALGSRSPSPLGPQFED